MNNRKQEIYSLLDSMTANEFDDYIKNRVDINSTTLNYLNHMKKYKEYKNETTHLQKLINKSYGEIQNLFTVGEANIIAMILYYSLHDKYDIKDFCELFKNILKGNKTLRECTYDIMKDFDIKT